MATTTRIINECSRRASNEHCYSIRTVSDDVPNVTYESKQDAINIDPFNRSIDCFVWHHHQIHQPTCAEKYILLKHSPHI